MNMDDLSFDLQCAQQKVDVLQRENTTLKAELELNSKGISSGGNDKYQEELEKMGKLLKDKKQMVCRMGQKYELVQVHLDLERRTINEIKNEVMNSYSTCVGEFSSSFNIILEKYSTSNAKLEKKITENSFMSGELFDLKNRLTRFIEEKEVGDRNIADLTETVSKEKQARADELNKFKLEAQDRERGYFTELDIVKEEIHSKDEALQAQTSSTDYLEKQVEEKLHLVTSLQNEVTRLKNTSIAATTIYEKNIISLNEVRAKDIEVRDLEISKIKKESQDIIEALKSQYQLKTSDLQTQVMQKTQENDLIRASLQAAKDREQASKKEIGSLSKVALGREEVQSRLESITIKLRGIEADYEAGQREIHRLTEALRGEQQSRQKERRGGGEEGEEKEEEGKEEVGGLTT